MANRKNRLLYIDVINCWAIFGVLVQHTAQIAHKGVPGETITTIGMILQTLFLPSVGLFFMNSGAMLLDYQTRENTKTFFKKRFTRVLIPFLVWSLIFYIYSRYYYAFPGIFHRDDMSKWDFIQSFLNNKINSLFWFFYAIIQLYIATPVFATLTEKNNKLLSYMVAIGIVFTLIVPYLLGIGHFSTTADNIGEPLLVSSWITYFIMGYLIKIGYYSRKIENIIIGLGLITLLLNLGNDILDGRIIFLENINTILFTFSVYLILKRISNSNSKTVHRMFANMSSASFGIYILHPFILQLLDWIAFKGTPRHWNHYFEILKNPVHIFVWPFVIYGLLLVIVIGLKKLKVFKYILP